MAFNRIIDVYFFTATILNWNYALVSDERKNDLIDTLKFLKTSGRIILYGYVIMPNHIHLIWQNRLEGSEKWKLLTQGSLLKFTSKKILNDMTEQEKIKYKVDASDRIYQIWERDPLWINCFNMSVLEQKLNYIHQNPCVQKWSLASEPSFYKYSSAQFYESGVDRFDLLTNIYD
jgi:putative transposase